MDASDDFSRALTSNKLRAAYETWKDLRGRRLAPKRGEITPARLRGILPSTFMIDVIDGGKDFRFRFAGERIIQFMGRRYAGTLLSAVRGSTFFDNMARMFEGCTEGKAPLTRGPVQASLTGKEFLEIEAMVLPLSEDGVEIHALFGAFESWQLGTHTSSR